MDLIEKILGETPHKHALMITVPSGLVIIELRKTITEAMKGNGRCDVFPLTETTQQRRSEILEMKIGERIEKPEGEGSEFYNATCVVRVWTEDIVSHKLLILASTRKAMRAIEQAIGCKGGWVAVQDAIETVARQKQPAQPVEQQETQPLATAN